MGGKKGKSELKKLVKREKPVCAAQREAQIREYNFKY